MARRKSPTDAAASLEDVGCLIFVMAIAFAICAGAVGSCIHEARQVPAPATRAGSG